MARAPYIDETVRTEGLTKVYGGGITAVDGLDLVVRRGEILGLLGPNGAGKSTTAGMLATRVLPTTGRAWIAGVDVVARPALVRQFIGVVPQTNTLDRSLSVRENLVFHGRFFGMTAADAAREADAWLERVVLTHVASRPVDALSGGMAQRLMIARAVMHRPAVLFLDEPTAGLDPQSRIALHELVRELHAAAQTILLITHDMEEADKLSDRIAIIDHGHLLALDTPAALKRSLHADTTVKVAGDVEPAKLAALLQGELSDVREAHVLEDAVLLTLGTNGAVLPILVRAAARRDITLRDVRIEEPTLETIFIGLTGKELRD
ncbi:MAG TPA: ABC transporter ATP-binding protein [Gaiellaceae bacterium]|jgi:ABC-2 type transport system ATP-binding protein|nr:ABC transporter ATP-binding protein [Gaiellaceae bacterium]